MKRIFLILSILAVTIIGAAFLVAPVSSQDGGNMKDWFTTRSYSAMAGSTLYRVQQLATKNVSRLTLTAPGTFYKLKDTSKITSIVPATGIVGPYCKDIYLTVTQIDTFVDGGNLKLVGNFLGVTNGTLHLVYSITGTSSDTFYTEVSRSLP